MGPRGRSRHHRGRGQRPTARAHLLRHRVGASQLFFQGDVTNVPDLFLRHPDWQVMFDHEPEKAVATRRRVYDMASADKLRVSGYHFPFPGLGYIETAGSGYPLIPAARNPAIWWWRLAGPRTTTHARFRL